MSKLSKEQIKRIADTASMFSSTRLMCDGYKISLQEQLVKRQLRVGLYVNGSIKGKWFAHPEDHAEIKFYRQRFMCIKKSPRSKKKEAIEVMRSHDFASIGQALRHLNKVCDSVELIEGEGL